MNNVKVINEQCIVGAPKELSKELEPITLDNWKPMVQKPRRLIQSEWRKIHNKGRATQIPSLDEIRKIKSYIQRGILFDEIAKIFNVTRRTVLDIAENRYREFGKQG